MKISISGEKMKKENQMKTFLFMVYTISKLIIEIITSPNDIDKKNTYSMDIEQEKEDNYFNDIIMDNIIKVEQINNEKISLGFKIFNKNNPNNFYCFKIQKGFTLIELMMVISIGLLMTFISFQQMLKEHENTTAKIAGQQIKQIGNSVNSYIAVHYDKIAILKNSENITQDPGPRICNNENSTCEISLQTLINEGLLPLTYNNKNIFNSDYKIILRRSGNSPYYNVTGLITTDNPWFGNNNNNIRYDLLGKAMQEAGIDSGMTRDIPSVLSGYKGLWTHNTAEFSNVNKLGQLGFQVGYGSYSYSIYLRRDGTLPMTGNLNMGSQSINNVKDITAYGLIQSKDLNITTFATLSETKINKDLYVIGNSILEGSLKVNNTINATSNIISNNQIKGKNLISEDRATFEEYVQINGKAVPNTNCNSNGLIGRETNGKLLSCVNGKWENNNNDGFKSVSSFNIYPGQTRNLGLFKLCVIGYRIDGKEMALTHLYPSNQPNGNGQMNWVGMNATQYSSYYFTAYCFN